MADLQSRSPFDFDRDELFGNSVDSQAVADFGVQSPFARQLVETTRTGAKLANLNVAELPKRQAKDITALRAGAMRELNQSDFKEDRGVGGKIKENLGRGNFRDISNKVANRIRKIQDEESREKAFAQWREINDVYDQAVQADPVEGENWFSRSVYSAAESGVPMAKAFAREAAWYAAGTALALLEPTLVGEAALAGRAAGQIGRFMRGGKAIRDAKGASAILSGGAQTLGAVGRTAARTARVGATTVLPYAKSAQGQIYADLRKEGLDHQVAEDVAGWTGLLHGAIEGVMSPGELVFGGPAAKVTSAAAKRLWAKVIGDSVKRTATRFGRGALRQVAAWQSEALEEYAQGGTEALARVVGRAQQAFLNDLEENVRDEVADHSNRSDEGMALMQMLSEVSDNMGEIWGQAVSQGNQAQGATFIMTLLGLPANVIAETSAEMATRGAEGAARGAGVSDQRGRASAASRANDPEQAYRDLLDQGATKLEAEDAFRNARLEQMRQRGVDISETEKRAAVDQELRFIRNRAEGETSETDTPFDVEPQIISDVKQATGAVDERMATETTQRQEDAKAAAATSYQKSQDDIAEQVAEAENPKEIKRLQNQAVKLFNAEAKRLAGFGYTPEQISEQLGFESEEELSESLEATFDQRVAEKEAIENATPVPKEDDQRPWKTVEDKATPYRWIHNEATDKFTVQTQKKDGTWVEVETPKQKNKSSYYWSAVADAKKQGIFIGEDKKTLDRADAFDEALKAQKGFGLAALVSGESTLQDSEAISVNGLPYLREEILPIAKAAADLRAAQEPAVAEEFGEDYKALKADLAEAQERVEKFRGKNLTVTINGETISAEQAAIQRVNEIEKQMRDIEEDSFVAEDATAGVEGRTETQSAPSNVTIEGEATEIDEGATATPSEQTSVPTEETTTEQVTAPTEQALAEKVTDLAEVNEETDVLVNQDGTKQAFSPREPVAVVDTVSGVEGQWIGQVTEEDGSTSEIVVIGGKASKIGNIGSETRIQTTEAAAATKPSTKKPSTATSKAKSFDAYRQQYGDTYAGGVKGLLQRLGGVLTGKKYVTPYDVMQKAKKKGKLTAEELDVYDRMFTDTSDENINTGRRTKRRRTVGRAATVDEAIEKTGVDPEMMISALLDVAPTARLKLLSENLDQVTLEDFKALYAKIGQEKIQEAVRLKLDELTFGKWETQDFTTEEQASLFKDIERLEKIKALNAMLGREDVAKFAWTPSKRTALRGLNNLMSENHRLDLTQQLEDAIKQKARTVKGALNETQVTLKSPLWLNAQTRTISEWEEIIKAMKGQTADFQGWVAFLGNLKAIKRDELKRQGKSEEEIEVAIEADKDIKQVNALVEKIATDYQAQRTAIAENNPFNSEEANRVLKNILNSIERAQAKLPAGQVLSVNEIETIANSEMKALEGGGDTRLRDRFRQKFIEHLGQTQMQTLRAGRRADISSNEEKAKKAFVKKDEERTIFAESPSEIMMRDEEREPKQAEYEKLRSVLRAIKASGGDINDAIKVVNEFNRQFKTPKVEMPTVKDPFSLGALGLLEGLDSKVEAEPTLDALKTSGERLDESRKLKKRVDALVTQSEKTTGTRKTQLDETSTQLNEAISEIKAEAKTPRVKVSDIQDRFLAKRNKAKSNVIAYIKSKLNKGYLFGENTEADNLLEVSGLVVKKDIAGKVSRTINREALPEGDALDTLLTNTLAQRATGRSTRESNNLRAMVNKRLGFSVPTQVPDPRTLRLPDLDQRGLDARERELKKGTVAKKSLNVVDTVNLDATTEAERTEVARQIKQLASIEAVQVKPNSPMAETPVKALLGSLSRSVPNTPEMQGIRTAINEGLAFYDKVTNKPSSVPLSEVSDIADDISETIDNAVHKRVIAPSHKLSKAATEATEAIGGKIIDTEANDFLTAVRKDGRKIHWHGNDVFGNAPSPFSQEQAATTAELGQAGKGGMLQFDSNGDVHIVLSNLADEVTVKHEAIRHIGLMALTQAEKNVLAKHFGLDALKSGASAQAIRQQEEDIVKAMDAKWLKDTAELGSKSVAGNIRRIVKKVWKATRNFMEKLGVTPILLTSYIESGQAAQEALDTKDLRGETRFQTVQEIVEGIAPEETQTAASKIASEELEGNLPEYSPDTNPVMATINEARAFVETPYTILTAIGDRIAKHWAVVTQQGDRRRAAAHKAVREWHDSPAVQDSMRAISIHKRTPITDANGKPVTGGRIGHKMTLGGYARMGRFKQVIAGLDAGADIKAILATETDEKVRKEWGKVISAFMRQKDGKAVSPDNKIQFFFKGTPYVFTARQMQTMLEQLTPKEMEWMEKVGDTGFASVRDLWFAEAKRLDGVERTAIAQYMPIMRHVDKDFPPAQQPTTLYHHDLGGKIEQRQYSTLPHNLMSAEELLMRNIDDAQRFLAYQEVYKDFSPMITQNKSPLTQKIGAKRVKELELMIESTRGVIDRTLPPYSQFMNKVVRRLGGVVLQNPAVWAYQYASATAAAREFGWNNMAKAIAGRAVQGDTLKKIRALAPELIERYEKGDIEASALAVGLDKYRTEYEQIAKKGNWAKHPLSNASGVLRIPMRFMDKQAIDTILMSAYHQAISQGMNEQMALEYAADEGGQAIARTQVSSDIANMTRLRSSQNPFVRAIAFMTGATSAGYQMFARDVANFKRSEGKDRAAAFTKLASSTNALLVQAFLIAMVKSLMPKPKDDEKKRKEKETLAQKMRWSFLESVSGYAPAGALYTPSLLKQLALRTENKYRAQRYAFFQGRSPYGEVASWSGDALEAITNLAHAKAETDQKKARRMIEQAERQLKRVGHKAGDFAIGINTRKFVELGKALTE